MLLGNTLMRAGEICQGRTPYARENLEEDGIGIRFIDQLGEERRKRRCHPGHFVAFGGGGLMLVVV